MEIFSNDGSSLDQEFHFSRIPSGNVSSQPSALNESLIFGPVRVLGLFAMSLETEFLLE
jgi:hypothetical protein